MLMYVWKKICLTTGLVTLNLWYVLKLDVVIKNLIIVHLRVWDVCVGDDCTAGHRDSNVSFFTLLGELHK